MKQRTPSLFIYGSLFLATFSVTIAFAQVKETYAKAKKIANHNSYSQESKAEKITGRIVGSNNQPIVGATISIKGTNKKTLTDANGMFSIEASKSDVLIISYIGFDTKEVTIGDNDN